MGSWLNAVSIVVPSLRERPEDIPRLASHFLRKHGPESTQGSTGSAARRSVSSPLIATPVTYGSCKIHESRDLGFHISGTSGKVGMSTVILR